MNPWKDVYGIRPRVESELPAYVSQKAADYAKLYCDNAEDDGEVITPNDRAAFQNMLEGFAEQLWAPVLDAIFVEINKHIGVLTLPADPMEAIDCLLSDGFALAFDPDFKWTALDEESAPVLSVVTNPEGDNGSA